MQKNSVATRVIAVILAASMLLGVVAFMLAMIFSGR